MTDPVRLSARFATAMPVAPLDLLWDREAGTVTGSLSATITRIAQECAAAGAVTYPQAHLYYPTTEPLRDPVALAILICDLGFRVPEPLRADLDAFANAARAKEDKGAKAGGRSAEY